MNEEEPLEIHSSTNSMKKSRTSKLNLLWLAS